jgi:hypothetical protein
LLPPKSTILFPVRLDDTVITASHPLADHPCMKRHIGDFTNWKDHGAYQAAFARRLA